MIELNLAETSPMAKIPMSAIRRTVTTRRVFNAQAFLDSAGIARKIVQYGKSETIYCQGDPVKSTLYIQNGSAKLSVLNALGKEAAVAILAAGDLFGEGCLAGQSVRMGTATAIIPTTVLMIDKQEMIRVLHAEHAFSDRFVSHMLSRNIVRAPF
jgi:CRP/FNR family cyclic AMP-dependent transcriptional regulator